MDCKREMIYFSDYEDGVKTRNAGYAAVFLRGDVCDVQLYYRGAVCESGKEVQPVYVFCDGTVVLGEKLPLAEGMAAAAFRTGSKDFMQSGRGFEELEVIYLDGVPKGICGGRPDGQGLKDMAYTLTMGADILEAEAPEPELAGKQLERNCRQPDLAGRQPERNCGQPELAGRQPERNCGQPELAEKQPERNCGQPEPAGEHWTLQQYMERLPEMKLPFDGVCRQCRKLTLGDLEHLPEEWCHLRENNFLLHAYYEYHHLLLVKFSLRNKERYAIGVPGEFSYRNRYTAESFGFGSFAPLNSGRCRGGCFGYWYYFLDTDC